MERAIQKAGALIEAMEYIRQFRGKIVVVKLGGSILDDMEQQRNLLVDVAFMATVGIQPVIVHGGGKAITRAMKDAGLEPHWVHGRRYTDERTLAIVEHTLVKKVNMPVVETIKELGIPAMGLHSLSSCVIFGEPLRLDVGGRKVDLGMVGKVTEVNAELIRTLCTAGTIPVIATVARDRAGGKLNINADSAAGMVAAALKAEKLVVLSDTHGIRMDINDPDSRISSANKEQVKELIEKGIINDGMMPKVEACFTAIDNGVSKAHIIDGRIPHSLLLEIYTDLGIGTEIVK